MRKHVKQNRDWNYQQQKINKTDKSVPVTYAFFFDKSSSKKCSCKSSKTAGASFAFVTATASESTQNNINYESFKNQVEYAINLIVKKYGEKRKKNPSDQGKVSQNEQGTSDFQFFFSQSFSTVF